MLARTDIVDDHNASVAIGWYVVLTEPSREVTAAAGVFAHRVAAGPSKAAYLPTFIKSVWAGRSRRRMVSRPLFPGYLFVPLLRGNEPWNRVRSIPGVRDFLKIRGCPITVPYAAIAAIMAKEAELLLPPKQRSSYRKGQQVEIIKGAFATFLGPIERMDGHGRVRVMLDVFSRATPIDLHESEIKPAYGEVA